MIIKMPAVSFIIVAIFLISGGCRQYMAEAPYPVAYPYTEQRKMQAMHHWNVLADNVANIIDSKLLESLPGNENVIYVSPAGIADFDKAFQQMLITKLVERGLVVSNNHKNPLVLSFDTQVVSHRGAIRDNWYGYPKKEIMVTLSLIFRGSYLMRNSSVYYIDRREWWHYQQKAEISEPAIAVYTLVDR